jgi:hypothetical protein
MVRRSVYNAPPRSGGGPFLVVESPKRRKGVRVVDVYFTDIPTSKRTADFKKAKLLEITPAEIRIFPLDIREYADSYLQPKHGPIVRLVVEMDIEMLPANQEDVEQVLGELPDGLNRDFRFGLGIPYEYRYIPELIADVSGTHTIRFFSGFADEKTARLPGEFVIDAFAYDRLRRRIDRITAHFQKQARSEKERYLTGALFDKIDPSKYTPPSPELSRNQIAVLTRDGALAPEKLSRRDRTAMLRTVAASVSTIVNEQPTAILALNAEIERVTLQQLIDRFETLLAGRMGEAGWQALFAQHAFILSLVFATTTLQVRAEVYVGGQRLDRNGGKLSDFLYQAASTGNLALIEIKHPGTPLLSGVREGYRADVYAPHKEVVAAVTQLLDQRFHLHKDIDRLKSDSARPDIHTNAVQCAVIAGRTPDGPAKRRSFDLYRHSLSNVTVLTFDELLSRLKEIERALSAEGKPALVTSVAGGDDDTTDADCIDEEA